MVKSALIVFVKEPLVGKVKTRLTPDLNNIQATELYKAFIQDSYQIYKKLIPEVDLKYYYFPSNEILRRLLPEQKNWQAQKGKSLGDKMRNAISEQLEQYKSCVIVGSDHPNLPVAYIKKAFSVLDYVDISIGPSIDGGYYCIGLKKYNCSIFQNITWSTENVFNESISKIRKENLEYFELPIFYDIDIISDLKRFISDVDLNTFPQTKSVLDTISL